MKKMLDAGSYINYLLSIYSLILTWQGVTQILAYFQHVGDLAIAIFAGVIGVGIGTITFLAILSIGCIFWPFGMWFWSGSYVAITVGGVTGGFAGVLCGILTRISIASYYL
jgi:hypothetical protein